MPSGKRRQVELRGAAPYCPGLGPSGWLERKLDAAKFGSVALTWIPSGDGGLSSGDSGWIFGETAFRQH